MLGDDHNIYFQNIVHGWHNHGHDWIHAEKWCITHIHTHKMKKLPNMVSLAAKWAPSLNSHWKTDPGHISYVPYWIKVNKFPNWATGYIYSTSKPGVRRHNGAVVKHVSSTCYCFRCLKPWFNPCPVQFLCGVHTESAQNDSDSAQSVQTGSEYVGECKLLRNSVNDESPPTFFGLGDAVEFFPKVLSKDTWELAWLFEQWMCKREKSKPFTLSVRTASWYLHADLKEIDMMARVHTECAGYVKIRLCESPILYFIL
jgi:hypothetical protein